MIRNLFGGRSDDVLSEYKRAGSALGVFALRLDGVEDPFDPDPFWDRKYGGNADIVEHLSGDHDFRLQAALDGCRNSRFVRDEAGRFREQTPVFTDVVLWMPSEPWKVAAMRGGHRIEALARNLALLHRKKFQRSLPGDRGPIYSIMPDDDLPEGTIVFQFGFGVFVPGGDDVLRARISLRSDKSKFQDLPEWSFWRDGGQIKRPVGVYEGQESILIAPNAASPIRAPIWFNRREGHILLNLNAADSERIYADDDHVEIVETILPKSDKDPLEWVLENRQEGAGEGEGGGGRDILVVRLTPLGAPLRLRETPGEQAVPEDARTRKVEMPQPAPKAKAKAKAAAKAKAEAKDKTRKSRERREPVLPGPPARAPLVARADAGVKPLLSGLSAGRTPGETPLSSRYMLRLAGIGLLRIDGPRQIDGLLDWIIWFDENGYPLQFEQAGRVDTTGCLALSASAKENTLLYRLAGEDGFKPVSHWPCVLPTAKHQHLRLTRSPLSDRYHGILFLNEETSFPLSSTPLVLGRSNLNPSARQPDLPLELLNHPETLRWASHGGFPGAKLNAINLSRRHIGVRLKGGNLDISMAEGTAPVFILDGNGGLQQALEAGSRHHVEIEPGEMILLGSYLLRFHLENPKTMSSAQHSMLRSRRPA